MKQTKTPPPAVKVGQVWKDNDKRMKDRFLRVEKVIDGRATCSRVDKQFDQWLAIGGVHHRSRPLQTNCNRIRSRIRSTGG